uniref:Uncharacterized protein n=1 Tax=Rhizophagus irregularis (strain DAOM 181602 / DAOM 197198 / MUCL 43194) TaxID=747089 RepID=U9TAE3_RHIID
MLRLLRDLRVIYYLFGIFQGSNKDAHGSNQTGSVHWRFGSVQFVSEPGEPSTHG